MRVNDSLMNGARGQGKAIKAKYFFNCWKSPLYLVNCKCLNHTAVHELRFLSHKLLTHYSVSLVAKGKLLITILDHSRGIEVSSLIYLHRQSDGTKLGAIWLIMFKYSLVHFSLDRNLCIPMQSWGIVGVSIIYVTLCLYSSARAHNTRVICAVKRGKEFLWRRQKRRWLLLLWWDWNAGTFAGLALWQCGGMPGPVPKAPRLEHLELFALPIDERSERSASVPVSTW